MTKKPQTHFIKFTNEPLLVAWGRDLSTFCIFLALIGIGIALQSTAMQWAGAIIGFLVIFSKASGAVKKMTIQEARAYLDELEGE